MAVNTVWYNGSNNLQTESFNYKKKLKLESQKFIGNTKWYLGGYTYDNIYHLSLVPNRMYTLERETETYSSTHTCKDGACPRATSWIGKIALIYPSDYGFATAGGTTSRLMCIKSLSIYNNISGATWKNNNYSDCRYNDWLYISSGTQWLLSPNSKYAYSAYEIDNFGIVSSYDINNNDSVRPTTYLKPNVLIQSGDGSPENPYIFG